MPQSANDRSRHYRVGIAMRRNWLAACAALLVVSAFFPANARARSTPAPAPQLTPVAPESVGFSSSRLRLLDSAMDRAVDGGEVAGILTMLVRHGKIVDLHMHGV